MPGYKVHLMGGLLFFLMFYYFFCNLLYSLHANIILCFCATLAGALFPDIDTKSKGQNIFYKILLILLIIAFLYQYYCMFIIVSFLLFVPILSRHRGLFHNLFFLLCFSVGTSFLIDYYGNFSQYTFFWPGLFFFIGALSHIFLDTFF